MTHRAKSDFPARQCSRAGQQKRPVRKISANRVGDVLAVGALVAVAMEGIVVDAEAATAVGGIGADETSSPNKQSIEYRGTARCNKDRLCSDFL